MDHPGRLVQGPDEKHGFFGRRAGCALDVKSGIKNLPSRRIVTRWEVMTQSAFTGLWVLRSTAEFLVAQTQKSIFASYSTSIIFNVIDYEAPLCRAKHYPPPKVTGWKASLSTWQY